MFKKLLLVERSTVKLLRAGLHHGCSDKDQEAWLYCEHVDNLLALDSTWAHWLKCLSFSQTCFNTGNSLGSHHGGLHLAFGGHCGYVQWPTETHCPWTEVFMSHSPKQLPHWSLTCTFEGNETLKQKRIGIRIWVFSECWYGGGCSGKLYTQNQMHLVQATTELHCIIGYCVYKWNF